MVSSVVIVAMLARLAALAFWLVALVVVGFLFVCLWVYLTIRMAVLRFGLWLLNAVSSRLVAARKSRRNAHI